MRLGGEKYLSGDLQKGSEMVGSVKIGSHVIFDGFKIETALFYYVAALNVLILTVSEDIYDLFSFIEHHLLEIITKTISSKARNMMRYLVTDPIERIK